MSAQDAGTQDQAEQGLAQQWFDEELKLILQKIALYEHPTQSELKMLCSALRIDIRDVT